MTTKLLDRCHRHETEPTLPRLCHTCQRIHVERLIVRRTVKVLQDAGYTLSESEDGQSVDYDTPKLLALLFDLDDAYLVATKDSRRSWVRFVFGNDGYDVISDYTTDLDNVLSPVMAYADTFDK